MRHSIFIYKAGKSYKSGIQIPWLPQEIEYIQDGTRLMTFDILDLGEVVVPNGRNLAEVSFSSIFPGEGRKDLPFLQGEWQEPKFYEDTLKKWFREGTKLMIQITSPTIKMQVYCTQFQSKRVGAYGDIEYTLRFKERENTKIEVVKRRSKPKKARKGAKQLKHHKKNKGISKKTIAEGTIYITKQDDELYKIAQRTLGDGSRWKEIYEKNKRVIEQAAKERGIRSSRAGSVLFAGIKLRLPSS